MADAGSALVPLVALMAASWALGFAIVLWLMRNPAFRHSLADVPGQMRVQVFVATGLSMFTLAPLGLRLSLFGLFAARLIYEAAVILPRPLTGRSVAVFAVMPMILLCLDLATMVYAAPFTLLLAFFLAELFDSLSLLGGKIFGKRHFAPRLSPQKTIEGFGVGAISVLVVCVCLWAAGIVSMERAALAWPAIVIAATAGDLLASFGKRMAGVKDYPALLSNQGGMLDMFDSWLLAAPTLAVVFWLV